MKDVIALILAAGKDDDRMQSEHSKLSHKIYGKEMIKRVVETVKKAGIQEIATVVGYKKEEVHEILRDSVLYIEQKEMLGSGHAVMQAEEYLRTKEGKVIILNGDVSILRPETITKLVKQSITNQESATILTSIYNMPSEYGRVIRDEFGNLKEILEPEELNDEMKSIQEINAGVYCFEISKLLEVLNEIKQDKVTREYKITDAISLLVNKQEKVGAFIAEDNTETLSANDRVQLELLTKILRMRINTEHMKNGVTIEDINTTYIYEDVIIGKDTVIHPNTTIKSNVTIGQNCEIGPNSYIREGCKLSNKVKIGSFVEIKKVIVGEGTKIPHLTYMGDAEIGTKCNIGCGTITCNYDGFNKSKTIIGNNVFIGSNVNLIAPVKIEDNVFIAAGSTITDDVPKESLAIARERQTNKEGWCRK